MDKSRVGEITVSVLCKKKKKKRPRGASSGGKECLGPV